MKKILVFALVAVLAVSSVFADSFMDDYSGTMKEGSWGVGLNLGTNTAVALKYGYSKFDAFANVGADLTHLSDGFSLGVDLGASWQVYDVDFGKGHHMPITVGAMIPVGIVFGDDFAVNLGALVQGALEYKLPKYPWSFYLRLGLGINFKIGSDFGIGLGYSAAIGALYLF